MSDTAQPLAAETATVADTTQSAADAFKAFLNPAQPRDDQGRFAAENAEEVAPEGVDEDEQTEEAEAAEVPEGEEAQPEATPLPTSWPSDKAEIWEGLDEPARAFIVERDAERDRAVQTKFHEAANAKKAVEAQLVEANTNRDQYRQAIDHVLSLVQLQEPNPADYGLGTDQYDRDAYDFAVYQYRQASQTVAQLNADRDKIAKEQAQEAADRTKAAIAEIEQVAWPKFVADVPDLQDQDKGQKIITEVAQYAISHGIPASAFQNADSPVTSAEMHIAWKAMQYDRIKEAEKRVKPVAQPKPAAPAVRPSATPTRVAVQSNRLQKAQARLKQSGSVEDAAAVFKHLKF